MAKRTSAASLSPLVKKAVRPAYIFPDRLVSMRALWLSLTLVIIVGLMISGVIALFINYWLNNVYVAPNLTHATSQSATVLPVKRSSFYAGLEITVNNAQYARSFEDDTVPSSSSIVRLNIQVANHTTNGIGVLYYEVARLLAPHMSPVAPTNLRLSADVQPGKTAIGWLDFALPGHVQLDTLTLQLGSVSLHETLVMIPLKGNFDPRHFLAKSSPQSLTIAYDFNGNLLAYHLKSVDVAYAYKGQQAQAGQQFYTLNFLVDNAGSSDISPGFGYDYIRLVIQEYSQAPLDSTLPATFKHGTRGVSGRVVFEAPEKMKTILLGFRSQFGGPQQNYTVRL